MPSATPNGRTKRIRRTGRHSAARHARKTTRWARRFAPVLALTAALGAALQIHSLTSATPTAAAGHPSAGAGLYPDQPAHAHLTALAVVRHDLTPPLHRKRPAARRSGHSTRSSATHRAAPASHTLTCSGTSGMLPAHYARIVGFLTSHGYTGLAAAGIAGNIYQESQGNPESVGTGGGGLIGWTPLPTGFVTGNIGADLRTQLHALLAFNQQWAQYLPALNAAASATQAADIYMADFERPGLPAAGNREAAANAVASACGL